MRSPGFTGELAVYRTSRSYRVAWSGRPTMGLALMVLNGRSGQGRQDCIPGCICVTPEGCPCCDVIQDQTLPPMRETHVALDCQPGQESVCEDWCAHQGGGVSSNPDGSTTCTVYTQLR